MFLQFFPCLSRDVVQHDANKGPMPTVDIYAQLVQCSTCTESLGFSGSQCECVCVCVCVFFRVVTPLKTNMTLENPHFLIGNASSQMVDFSIVMLVFRWIKHVKKPEVFFRLGDHRTPFSWVFLTESQDEIDLETAVICYGLFVWGDK